MASSNEVTLMVRAKADLSSATRAINQFKSTIGSIGKTAMLGFAGGVAAATVAGAKFLQMAIKEQAGIARLTAAIGTLDASQRLNAAGVEQLVAQRERLSFADDQIRDSLSLLIAQTGSYTDAVDRNRLAMDVSRGTGIDLGTASRLLGKINEETTNTFARYGIVIRDGATETEALAEIQRRFSGQAQAYADSAAGRWDFFKNQLANIGETIGSALLPAFTRLADRAGLWITQNQPAIQAFADGIAVELPKAIDAVVAAFDRLAPVMQPFIDFIVNHPADVLIIAGAIGGVLVVAMGAYVYATIAAIVATTTLATALTLGLAVAIPLVIAGIVLLVRNWDQVWASMQAAPAALLAWLKSHWADVLIAVVAGPLPLILKYWGDIFNAMPGPVQTAMNAVSSIVEGTINGILAAFQKMVRLIGDGIDKIRVPGTRKMLDSMGLTAGVQDALQNFDAGSVDFTLRGGPQNEGFREGVGRNADGQFGAVGAGAAAALPPVLDLGIALGGGGGGGGGLAGAAGGVTDAVAALTPELTEAQQGLVDLAAVYQAASAANVDLTAEAFKSQIELGSLAQAYQQSGMGLEEFINALNGFTQAMLDRAAELARSTRGAINTVSTGSTGYVDENGVRHTFGGNLTDEGLKKIRAKYPWIKDSDIKRTPAPGYPSKPSTSYHAPVTINNYDASDRSTVMGLR